MVKYEKMIQRDRLIQQYQQIINILKRKIAYAEEHPNELANTRGRLIPIKDLIPEWQEAVKRWEKSIKQRKKDLRERYKTLRDKIKERNTLLGKKRRKLGMEKYYCPICGRRLVEKAYGRFSLNQKRILGQLYGHTRDYDDCPIKAVYINSDIDIHPAETKVPLVLIMDFKRIAKS